MVAIVTKRNEKLINKISYSENPNRNLQPRREQLYIEDKKFYPGPDNKRPEEEFKHPPIFTGSHSTNRVRVWHGPADAKGNSNSAPPLSKSKAEKIELMNLPRKRIKDHID